MAKLIAFLLHACFPHRSFEDSWHKDRQCTITFESNLFVDQSRWSLLSLLSTARPCCRRRAFARLPNLSGPLGSGRVVWYVFSACDWLFVGSGCHRGVGSGEGWVELAGICKCGEFLSSIHGQGGPCFFFGRNGAGWWHWVGRVVCGVRRGWGAEEDARGGIARRLGSSTHSSSHTETRAFVRITQTH